MLFSKFWDLYPSTKLEISPMFFEQFKKFQCLSLSTTQGLSTGTLRFHVARVTCPQTCLKVMQLWGAESLNSPGKIFQKSLFSPQGVTTIWFLAKNSMYIFFCRKPQIFEVWITFTQTKLLWIFFPKYFFSPIIEFFFKNLV